MYYMSYINLIEKEIEETYKSICYKSLHVSSYCSYISNFYSMDELTDIDTAKDDNSNACGPSLYGPLQDDSSDNSTASDDSDVASNDEVVHPLNMKGGCDNPHNLAVGSAVQYFQRYGIIKWIGILPGDRKASAKVEMVIGYE